MLAVIAKNLCKTYRVAQKQSGLIGTLQHFVSRKYRNIQAVKNVSFNIEHGEIVGFLGPNGAGKTTTLKILTGLIKPTSGRAEVIGHRPFKREHALLREVTLVMGQKQQLIWDLPAMESLRINAAVYEIPDRVFRRRVDELSEMLNLGTQLNQPVRKLSLGERMKAELLAALLHRPTVLFLDEPTLGLDINAQASMRTFLRQYNRHHNATILLTSHYMADITALCSRVLVIHEGELMYDGSLEDIVERFAPYREVKVKLASPVSGPQMRQYGELESLDGHMVSLLVQRDALTTTVERILAEQDVVDLMVADPPIERVIGRLFAEGLKS